MEPRVQIEGVDDVRRTLKIFGDAGLKVALKAAHTAGAEQVAQEALPMVPHRTGALRASVRALGSVSKGNVKAGTAKVNYAASIHWGRKNGRVWRGRIAPSPITGRPFLWDALKRREKQVNEEFAKQVDLMLDTVRAK